MVAVGQAHPTGEGVLLHSHPLPAGYAKVNIDELAKGRYHGVELDLPNDWDRKTLGQNLGCFVAWHK